MEEIEEIKKKLMKFKKGFKFYYEKNELEIVSDLMKFKNFYAIYADIAKNDNMTKACCVTKIKDEPRVALIIRNREKLEQIGLTREERTAIYCHELGHVFSPNQQHSHAERSTEDEVDSDTFAVEQCGVSPYVLERALAKTYEYDINRAKSIEGLTKERLDRYVNEMRARKRNVERLIRAQKDLDDKKSL